MATTARNAQRLGRVRCVRTIELVEKTSPFRSGKPKVPGLLKDQTGRLRLTNCPNFRQRWAAFAAALSKTDKCAHAVTRTHAHTHFLTNSVTCN
jgi:hypothetical protein